MKQNEFWDKRSDKYDLKVREEKFFATRIDKAKSLLRESDVILDVGCATGEIGLELANFVKHLHGIDTSKVMIDNAKRKAEEKKVTNVDFECIDVYDQGIKKNAYDKVLVFNVLHLVGNPADVIKRMSELLKSGGSIISETPCLEEWGWLFRIIITAFVKIGMAPPIVRLSYKKLKQVFLDNKFEIVQEEVVDETHKVLWIVAQKG